MESLVHRWRNHLIRSFVAGIVALLPIAGLIVTVVYFENQVAGGWLKQQGFYFFGLGLVILLVLVYGVGLTVSTFVGQWLWRRVDRLLVHLPILGSLYQTVKQIVGYAEGPGGLFQRVVWVPAIQPGRFEIGLVTMEACAASQQRLVVYVPTAPTPTSGRLVYLEPDKVQDCPMTASQAMQLLVSLGTLLPEQADAAHNPASYKDQV
ncbi:MAG: DUF502 domain-containing protein [Pirellulaceae bacterium]|nr:DUF502 domain-containing protein [Pirellulaceae bacterium]